VDEVADTGRREDVVADTDTGRKDEPVDERTEDGRKRLEVWLWSRVDCTERRLTTFPGGVRVGVGVAVGVAVELNPAPVQNNRALRVETCQVIREARNHP
jgi:hypothetical protein